MSITLMELVELCEGYSKLGWAIQEQLRDAVNLAGSGQSLDDADLNGTAVEYIKPWLRDVRQLFSHFTDPDEALPEIIIDIDDTIAWLNGEQEPEPVNAG